MLSLDDWKAKIENNPTLADAINRSPGRAARALAGSRRAAILLTCADCIPPQRANNNTTPTTCQSKYSCPLWPFRTPGAVQRIGIPLEELQRRLPANSLLSVVATQYAQRVRLLLSGGPGGGCGVAIRLNCLLCCGGNRADIGRCTAEYDCALWWYRTGKCAAPNKTARAAGGGGFKKAGPALDNDLMALFGLAPEPAPADAEGAEPDDEADDITDATDELWSE